MSKGSKKKKKKVLRQREHLCRFPVLGRSALKETKGLECREKDKVNRSQIVICLKGHIKDFELLSLE